MRIAILGYGEQGKSAHDYWSQKGDEITICDQSKDIKVPSGTNTKLGKNYLNKLDEFDLLVRSPSVHPRDIVKANSPEILDKVWSNTNEFFKVCSSKNIIGVTGTKGKGTTSTLIAKILEAAGKKVHLGGNIGTPPLDLLKGARIQPEDWVVLELANFQLIDLKFSPHIGVCLMIESEHMDWHEDYDEYIDAKTQLFINQTGQDIAIYYARNDESLSIANSGDAKTIPYMEIPGAVVEKDIIKIDDKEICEVADLKLLGKHNWENACAAVTAVWFSLSEIEGQVKINAIRSVLTTFSGLEHRLEFVREFDGVKYYDDSFGTTPSTAKVAIEAFSSPKVVILGGSDKGAAYEELAKAVASNNVRAVIAVGQTGPEITEVLKKSGYKNIIEGGKTMKEIVKSAQSAAQAGDVVLLSTGCASFGMFKNYKDRGEQFKKAVNKLI